MVAHLFRLKLALLRNGFRRSVAALIGMVLGLVYGGGVVVLVFVGLIGLRVQGDPGLARTAVVLGGAVLVLGWALLPVLMFGIDPTLDPSRFATFSVPERTLGVGLLLAGLVGFPGLATVLVVLGTVVAGSRSVPAALAALVGGLLGLLTCILLSRIVTGVASALLSTRRGRDAAGALGLLTLLSLGPLANLAGDRGHAPAHLLSEITDVVAWTPLGWAWAAGGDVATGHGTVAVLRLLLAAVWCVALFAVWERILVSVLRNPRPSSGDGAGARHGLGLFDRLPGTAIGAVAARSGTYWVRDPRFNFPVLVTILLPGMLLVPATTSGSPLALAAMPLASAYLIGWGQHNDVGYDSTAFWMHVVSGVDGLSDRLGRLFPSAVVATVCVPTYSVLAAVVGDLWALLPAMLGVATALVLNGFAVACVTSAVRQYAVPAPGENPFSSRPGSVGVTLAVQAVCGAAVVALSLPVLALGVAAWFGAQWAAWAALLVGPGLGALALRVGARQGATLFERRQADLMQDLVSMA